MCLVVSPRYICSLVIVPLLLAILAFPASAQTSSESNSTVTNSRDQSELTAGPTSSNPATPKTGSDTATQRTQTNSTTTKAEPAPGGSQPQSNPAPKRASAILININKAKQKITVFVD